MSTPQILVVEDEGITAMDLEARLKGLGYSVPAVVSSGEEAILRAEETHPDLVLMDIVLRGQTDGVQAAQELQSRLGIPVVYLTAYFDDATLERAKATEPFGYIIKPFKDINLRTSIEIALRRHEAENAWLVARHGVESPVQCSATPVTNKEGNNGDAALFFEAIDAAQVGEAQRAEPLGVSETLVPSRPLSIVEGKPAERMGLLEALVQNSPLATVVLDPQQRVLICNPAFGDLFLYQRQEILGHKLDELIKDYVTGTDTIEVSSSVLSGQVLHTTGRRCRSDGTAVDVEICGVPVFVNGKLEGVSFIRTLPSAGVPRKRFSKATPCSGAGWGRSRSAPRRPLCSTRWLICCRPALAPKKPTPSLRALRSSSSPARRARCAF